ncbi:MAG: hypothetical protein JW726_14750 [Anaerolineales bacterium]|nr:hypothetical protein [Anaerolineales bacterium]
MIRPFEWRDFPVLNRHRRGGLFLDNALVLTHGPVLVPACALFAYFAPAIGTYTYVSEADQKSDEMLFGQAVHTVGASYARLSFLAPKAALVSGSLFPLLDHLARRMGERGAFHILAEVEDRSDVFQALHQSGFAIHARQRIWQLPGDTSAGKPTSSWRACGARDVIGVRTLYNNLVPGFVQQAEPLPKERLKGLVYYREADLLGYVELRYGTAGIWAQPFIHPDAESLALELPQLLSWLPNRRSRPVYLCIRSYQSWLETPLQAVGASAGPVQAMMVRHLAVPRRATETYTVPALNGTRTEPIAHIVEDG